MARQAAATLMTGGPMRANRSRVVACSGDARTHAGGRRPLRPSSPARPAEKSCEPNQHRSARSRNSAEVDVISDALRS